MSGSQRKTEGINELTQVARAAFAEYWDECPVLRTFFPLEQRSAVHSSEFRYCLEMQSEQCWTRTPFVSSDGVIHGVPHFQCYRDSLAVSDPNKVVRRQVETLVKTLSLFATKMVRVGEWRVNKVLKS